MTTQNQPACCRRQLVRGKERLIFETAAGQRVTLNDGPVSIVVEDSSGNSIKLENGKVTVSSPGKLVLQAALVEINGSAVKFNASTVQCGGLLQADTVVANTVTAATYTPGVGNVW
jgi:uncharacterized protein (DUF2345 family)